MRSLNNKNDLEAATKVTILEQALYWPSTTQLVRLLRHNMIQDCDSTLVDHNIRNNVYGEPWPPNIEKSVRKKPMQHSCDIVAWKLFLL